MRRLAFALVLLPALAAPVVAVEPGKNFFFKDGDRIVFLGDSITEQYQYSSDMELYLTTRFPKWKLAFLNAGISGDTASGGAGRYAEHVLAEKPTAVTIDFGMNDAGYGAFNAGANKNYVDQTRAMLEMSNKAGIRVALTSPNAVDRRVQERFKLYLETQKQFYAPLKELAAKHQAVFVDQYAVTRAALEKMEQDDPMAKKVRPFGDGFHTSPPGGLLMAHAILTGLGAPGTVSDAAIAIDVAGNKAVPTACKISKLKCAADAVEFDRLDEALAMPIPKDWASVVPYTNQLKDLNWYGLKVTGLGSGKYELKIDGQAVGSYTSEELAAGVNVGLATSGPIYEQGMKVLQALNAKNEIVHQRFRGVVMFKAPDWLADVAKERRDAELAKRMKLIDEHQAKIYALAQPKEHHFELKAVK
jgi:lysophospholipase L1-like esterase